MSSICCGALVINHHPSPLPNQPNHPNLHPMADESDLPPAAFDHVSSMLTLAKRKHEEAMAMVGTPDANAIPRLRQVLQLLEEVELLAEDAGSYVQTDAVAIALRELQQQQASIRLAIERLETLSKRSPWASPLPWIVLVIVVLVVLGAVR